MKLKIDFHVHTQYSHDAMITVEELVHYAKKRGLDGVAITDHDRLEGAIKIAKETDLLVIPGVEVSSLNGHVVALNIRENIPRNLSADETVDRIHEAGGKAIACHPIGFLKGGLGKHVNSKFDAVEVINASAFPFNYSVRQCRKLASTIGIAQVAGSDAHYGPEIGYAYTVISAEPTVEDVIKALTKGLCEPFGKAIPIQLRVKRKILCLKKRNF